MESIPTDILPAIVQTPRAAEALRCCSRDLYMRVVPFRRCGKSLTLTFTNGWWTVTLDECKFYTYEEFRDGYYQIGNFCENILHDVPVRYNTLYLYVDSSKSLWNICVFTGDRIECTRWGMTRYNYEFMWGSDDDCAYEHEYSLYDTPDMKDTPFDYLLHGGDVFASANGGFRAVPCDRRYLKKALEELNGYLVFQYKRAATAQTAIV
jgi:hypothetical protein